MKEWIKEHMILTSVMVLGFLVLLFYFFSPLTDQPYPENHEEMEFPVEALEEQQPPTEPKTIMADVKGAITNPGVYEAKEGERVIDIITRAGGLTEKADQSQVNLAMYVVDEMVLYIPEVGEAVLQDIGSANTSTKEDKVNLNAANQAELETLPGIGPSKSTAIIEYRETNGPFKKIEDIQSISGFGEKTFEKLKDKIVVK